MNATINLTNLTFWELCKLKWQFMLAETLIMLPLILLVFFWWLGVVLYDKRRDRIAKEKRRLLSNDYDFGMGMKGKKK